MDWDLPEGIRFAHGLAGLLGGVVIWIVMSLITAGAAFTSDPNTWFWTAFTYLGFGVMIVSPLWYWLCRPIWINWKGHDDAVRRRLAWVGIFVPFLIVLLMGGVYASEMAGQQFADNSVPSSGDNEFTSPESQSNSVASGDTSESETSIDIESVDYGSSVGDLAVNVRFAVDGDFEGTMLPQVVVLGPNGGEVASRSITEGDVSAKLALANSGEVTREGEYEVIFKSQQRVYATDTFTYSHPSVTAERLRIDKSCYDFSDECSIDETAVTVENTGGDPVVVTSIDLGIGNTVSEFNLIGSTILYEGESETFSSNPFTRLERGNYDAHLDVYSGSEVVATSERAVSLD